MKVLICILVGMSVIGLGSIQAQEEATPKVFLLGQQEATYDQLVQTYRQTLLEACNNNMELAFDRWLDMMKDMEAYAQKINFDINGVKLLLHVFWNEDGSIAHLAYFLRPNSRNINTDELTAFLTQFIGQYKFQVTSSRKFAHYTKASFPTFDERSQR